MRRLPRHDLRRDDGRRVHVYGELRGGFGPSPATSRDREGREEMRIHKRLDVLADAWVDISPARNVRPLDDPAGGSEPEGCPFCPGGAELPFPYDAAVFDNRFPSFHPAPPAAPDLEGPTGPARGRCEVVLYTHRHDTSFGGLSPEELGRVLAVWCDRAAELWLEPAHEYVFVFENRGAEAGATIAHPHGQIFAIDHLPPLTAAKLLAHRRRREQQDECLSCAVTSIDSRSSRVVARNSSFVVAVPFAARWPFEVAVRARRHGLGRLSDLSPAEQRDLAEALRDVARRYDALFGFELPYMMVAQEAPRDAPDWHLAFEFYPLHRSPTATKIRASVETALGLFLNDVLPEDAAGRLAEIAVSGEPIDVDSLWQVVPADGGKAVGRLH